MKLADRVALVTGAAQGIGQAIAARFAAEGAQVALFDQNHAAVATVAAEIGPGARAYQVDIGDEDAVRAAVEKVLGEFDRIDVLVNNAAARTPRAKITELAPADFRKALEVNITGIFLLCRAVLPGMLARKSGRIINIASQLGSVAVPGHAAYCASKGAVLQLTRALALDHAADGVLVNSLSPGAVLTPRILDRYGTREAAAAALTAKHPVGRIAQPEDIAGAAVFLAGGDARFMTGADLVIDGGYLAQ